MKIFYSWQSDIDVKLNRYFIKDCLERAIKQLNQELKIEDTLSLDYDTKDVEGTPDIANAILEKIDKCDIFVGDISFVAKSNDDKYCSNPNVLIELGYALNCLSDRRVINVMNSAFGEPTHLPFNLAHKRWPIRYELNNEKYSNKTEERNLLVASFKSAFFPFINKSKVSKPTFTSNAEKIRYREQLRKEFEKELLEIKVKDLRADIIIRDVDRVDGYPNIEDAEDTGISAWFRLGLLENYTRGIRVLLKIGMLTHCEGGYRYCDYDSGEENDIKAFLVGEIPYDSIVTVNWKGDEYYCFPHIYCHFNHNAQPYERLIFCEKIDMGHGHSYYKEISEYNTVSKNSEQVQGILPNF